MIRILLILAILVVRIFVGLPPYLMDKTLLSALSYPLFHANWFHLAVNCLALWLVFPPKRKGLWSDLALGYVISCLVFPISIRPVIGISNLLYAVIGLRTPAFSSPWWKKTEVIIFFAVTFAMLPFPQVSGLTHILSLAAGIGIAAICRSIKKVTEDARKSLGRR